ncbi:MAG: 23S rRNA (adenine(2503)-C(2))-methyltransferase RlmN [Candidatus Omnitrophota bacterium]
MSPKKNIKDFSLPELEQMLLDFGYQKFNARQIFSWIYKKQIDDFDKMSDLPAGLRVLLKKNFISSAVFVKDKLQSYDGTRKLLFELCDKNLIEGVIIPTRDWITGCVSTQAGCKYNCSFCASGVAGFKRNLTVAEIIDEVLCLKKNSVNNSQDDCVIARSETTKQSQRVTRLLRPFRARNDTKEAQRGLTHLVFMGTGEPFDNYANVLKAVRIINSAEGFNIGARRITISTSGLIQGIEKLAKEGLQIELSVSLHAADDKTRSLLMPVNKIYPLRDLLNACKKYIRQTNRQVTFEYILIKGLNSDLQSAQKLGKLLKGMNCKVNLIPANPIEQIKIYPPAKPDILSFEDSLLKSGVNVILRRPRGQDIEAACGQLRLKYEKK